MSQFLHDTLRSHRSVEGRSGIAYSELRRAGFQEGRQFRTFKELDIAALATYVIKIVVPVNTVLFGLELAIDQGFLRLETVVGGTEGGTFSESITAFPQNNQTTRPTPFYTPQIIMSGGGTHTGGTVIDVVRLKTDTNTNRAASVGAVGQDERGVSPNTYYFRLVNPGATDAVLGTLKVRWEERP